MDKRSIIAGKDLERHFEYQSSLIEFHTLFTEEESDRAVAIIGGAFLDATLENILINFFVDDEKESARLLAPDRALGSYGNRVSAVYCLGLIGKIVRDDLRMVGKIRNRFAHDLGVSFDSDPIRQWCRELKWHRISLIKDPPAGAVPRDYYQVGVNQLICYLHGIVSMARMERRENPSHGVE